MYKRTCTLHLSAKPVVGLKHEWPRPWRAAPLFGAWLVIVLATLWTLPARADRFDQLMADNQPKAATAVAPVAEMGGAAAASAQPGAAAVLSLEAYERLRQQKQQRRRPASKATTSVVFGATRYRGEVIDGVLHLTGDIDVELSGDAVKWVPLAGSSVLLLEVRADGKPVGVNKKSGYHLWRTTRAGKVHLQFRGLVTANGLAGSSSFSFGCVRAPITEFTARMSGGGISPVVDGAVRSDTKRSAKDTTVVATLKPTTRIRLSGLFDFGQQQHRPAKLYAESFTLLSVDETRTEMFSVVRYNILQGSASDFTLRLPAGFEVVAADGTAGLRSSIRALAEGSEWVGRTSRPVRDRFELSLRLRRVHNSRDAHALKLPECVGVEQHHGWLAIEVPGKLQLATQGEQALTRIDVRQLPNVLIDAAVSPILRAYRHVQQAPQVTVVAKPLPEVAMDSASIDRLQATSVLSPGGTLVTELRITLRNRLRPTLKLGLAEDTTVRSVLLDGEPVKASRDQQHRLSLPLRRSRGGERLEPFEVVVVWEQPLPPWGLFGRRKLTLPSIDMPVAQHRWGIYLPGGHHYAHVRGQYGPPLLWGSASWHKPAHIQQAVRWTDTPQATRGGDALAGALPVRFDLPRNGQRHDFQRYWVAAEEPVSVSLVHLRPWLWWLLAAAGMALTGWLLARLVGSIRVKRWANVIATTTATVVVLALTQWLNLPAVIAGGGLLAIGLLLRRPLMRGRWWRMLRVAARRAPRGWRRWLWAPGMKLRQRVPMLLAGVATLCFAWLLLRGAWRVADVLLLSSG